MYHITTYSFNRAKDLGVKIYPSLNPKYKIAVYNKDDEFLYNIGAIDYLDFPTYAEHYGLEYALKRRRLYKIRHEKDRKKYGTRGWFADKILW